MKHKRTLSFTFNSEFQQTVVLLFIFIFCVALFPSCKKNLGFKPAFEKNHFISQYTDSLAISCSIKKEDSLPTQLLVSNMFGILNDATFGKTYASIFSQVILSSASVDFGNVADLRADSIVLSLEYSSLYGNKNQALPISVYELTNNLNSDSTYYAQDTVSHKSTPLGYEVFMPDPYDSVIIDSLKEAPQVRVKLNISLAKEILQHGSFANNADFLSFFKGIYIAPDLHAGTPVNTGQNSSTHRNEYYNPIPPLNTGIMCNFYLQGAFSGITLYYTDTTTGQHTSYQFNMSSAAKSFSSFRHDYQNTVVQGCLNDSNFDSLHTYLQSMDGPTVKLSIKNWENFKQQHAGKIAVVKAVLELPVAANTTNYFAPPNQIILVRLDQNGGRNFLMDYYEGLDYFGGSYDAETNSYQFNVTRNLNRLLSGQVQNYGYELLVSGRAVDPSRVVLNSNKNATNPMVLKIYYNDVQ